MMMSWINITGHVAPKKGNITNATWIPQGIGSNEPMPKASVVRGCKYDIECNNSPLQGSLCQFKPLSNLDILTNAHNNPPFEDVMAFSTFTRFFINVIIRERQ